ncbi:flavodoxin family protein [Thermodesulfobacteriota bacterium]
MKVLVVNAAPRMEAGNTQMILNPLLVGMRHEGASVDVCYLGRKKIERCIGCFTCYAKTPGRCIHQDDMPAVIERVRMADMMVLATPVYVDGMTSLAKSFIDRLVVFLDPHFMKTDKGLAHPLRWKFPGKLLLMSVCGYPGVHNFEPLLLHMERISRNFHSEFIGAILRPAVFSCLLTHKYPDRIKAVMDAVRIAGEQLAQDGTMSQENLDAASADICSAEELMNTANSYWDRELEKYDDEPA